MPKSCVCKKRYLRSYLQMEKPKVIRCSWVTEDPLYIKYHDEEWGRPVYDNFYLFEMICLEGQQAGLSWLTILRKRESYRKKFYNFNPHRITKITETNIDEFLKDPSMIRHKGKLDAIVNNAKCYVRMENEGEDFSKFIWSFVEHKPLFNDWLNQNDVPKETEISKALSKALKYRGFKFIGPTICYAFMEACGLINNHIKSCICRSKEKI